MATYVRVLSIPDVLRGSVQIYRNHFLSILGIYFLPVFPAAALQAIAQVEEWPGVPALAMILASILQLVAQGALTIAISDVCLGFKPSAKRSYRRLSASTAGKLLATGLEVALVVFVLVFLVAAAYAVVVGVTMWQDPQYGWLVWVGILFAIGFTILGLWFFLSVMFIAPVVVLEGHWGIAAIKRSRQLTKGHLLRNLAAFLLILLPIVVAGGLLGGVLGVLLISPESREFNLVLVAIQHLVAAPLALILVVLLYYDLRARKEGYDMTTLEQDLMR